MVWYCIIIIRGQAAKLQNPIVFVRFPIIIIIIIIIILQLESMAAHRTPWLRVVQIWHTDSGQSHKPAQQI